MATDFSRRRLRLSRSLLRKWRGPGGFGVRRHITEITYLIRALSTFLDGLWGGGWGGDN